MRKVIYLMGVLDEADIDWIARHGKGQEHRAGHDSDPGGQAHRVPLHSARWMSLRQCERKTNRYSIFRRAWWVKSRFVDSRPPLATVTGDVPSRVLMVPRIAMQRKLLEDHKFAANFYRAIAIFLADRLRTTTGRLGYGNVQQDSQDISIR